MKYKRINQLKLKIKSDRGVDYVLNEDLNKVLRKHKLTKLFNRYFGIQTAYRDGLYAYDVEAVLERIASGKLTGTQLLWD